MSLIVEQHHLLEALIADQLRLLETLTVRLEQIRTVDQPIHHQADLTLTVDLLILHRVEVTTHLQQEQEDPLVEDLEEEVSLQAVVQEEEGINSLFFLPKFSRNF